MSASPDLTWSGQIPPKLLSSKEEGVPVPAGSTFEVHSGGGGGWGDPRRRSPSALEVDRENGFATKSHERHDSGTAR